MNLDFSKISLIGLIGYLNVIISSEDPVPFMFHGLSFMNQFCQCGMYISSQQLKAAALRHALLQWIGEVSNLPASFIS